MKKGKKKKPNGSKINLELGILEIPANTLKTNKVIINRSEFSKEDIDQLSQKINQFFHQEGEERRKI